MNRFIYSILLSIAMLTACQVLEVDKPSAKERNSDIADSVRQSMRYNPNYAGEDSLLNLFLEVNDLPISAVSGYHPRASNITSFHLSIDSIRKGSLAFPKELNVRNWQYIQMDCVNPKSCVIDSISGIGHLDGLLSLGILHFSMKQFPNDIFKLEDLAHAFLDCAGDMEQPLDLLQEMNRKRNSLVYLQIGRCGWTTLPEDLHKLDPTISLSLSGNKICEPRPEWLQSWIIERSEVRGGSKLYFEPQYCNGELD